MTKRRPNLILIGIDSLRRDRMSLHGYRHLTTPHIDKYVAKGAVFEQLFSPHIPTTPAYSSMFTGMDCFGTDVVALRHKGPLGDHVKPLAEILGEAGYNTTCVGFSGNPAARNFKKYIDFDGWGQWSQGRAPKGENLNKVSVPELKRLAGEQEPFFLFFRHMDPHSPYLPPAPFERMFYAGDEYSKENKSLEAALSFKPFSDYFASWFPPGCTDAEYIDAQYDGSVAYMDACLATIFEQLTQLKIEEETLVVITSDHGETLNEHDCLFDHHGLYECTLTVPLAFFWPGTIPAGGRFSDICAMKDLTPTIVDLLALGGNIAFDGRSLAPLWRNESREGESEFYITECTWMRKHGWRTPKWKYIHALEPDFHFKPEIELYDLEADPGETKNLAQEKPEIVAELEERMQTWIAQRVKKTGRENPMYTNLDWHGKGCGPFTSSQQAYDSMHISSPGSAKSLQSKELSTQRGQETL